MFEIDRYGRTPIYEQIIEKTSRLISAGILKAEDQLPSVRTLSERLSINPNTLQKAYSELERQGICYSVPGSGRFVSKNAAEIVQARALTLLDEVEGLSRRLNAAGVLEERVHGAVNRAYGRGEGQ